MRRVALRVTLVSAALVAVALVGLVAARTLVWRAMARSDRLVRAAQELSGRGDRLAARAKVEEALRVYPGNSRAHRELGLQLLSEGKVEEGLAELRQVAEARSRDPGAAWEFAHALSAASRPAEAEPWFRRVIRMEGSNGAAYAMLANCQLQRGAKQEALESAERGVALSPRVSTTHSTLGLVRWQSGDLEGARAALEEALRLRPSDVRTRLSLAAVAGQLRRYDLAAEELTRAVQIIPDDANLWIALGTARYENRQVDAAERAFSRALALDPENEMARAALARLRESRVAGSEVGGESVGPSSPH